MYKGNRHPVRFSRKTSETYEDETISKTYSCPGDIPLKRIIRLSSQLTEIRTTIQGLSVGTVT